MNEIKQAVRQLALRPGLSATVILMLALGIGATTAIFSLFNEVLLQSLPVADPGRLVTLTAPGIKLGSGRPGLAVGDVDAVWSYPQFRDFEARQTVLTNVAAHYDFLVNLGSGEGATFGPGVLVSSHYFEVLGVKPALGRFIGPQDEPAVGESAVVVLSYDYWERQLGANPAAIGDTLAVNGHELTIVGVAPKGFEGAMLGWRPNVYVPITLRWLMQPEEPYNAENRLYYWLYMFGRLKPGVSEEQATAALNVLFGAMVRDVEAPLLTNVTDEQRRQFLAKRLVLTPGGRGQSNIPGQAQLPLTMLLGVTTLVLLIVCVNIANLLLARGAARAGELAVRTSIGASRARLVGQLLAEAGTLAVLGVAASLPLAAGTLKLVVALFPAGFLSRIDASLSWRAMGFAAAAGLGTVLLFGLVPALQVTGTSLAAVMKNQSAKSPGARGAARLNRWLVTAQIGFATVLLVLAGLFTQSLMNAARSEIGMSVDSLASFNVSPLLAGYGKDDLDGIYDRVSAALAAQPGVLRVGSGAVPLLANISFGARVQVVGAPERSGDDANSEAMLMLGEGTFAALGVPLLAGRDFSGVDRTSNAAIVVNEAFVRKFGLGSGALGQHVRMQGYAVPAEAEIVGVVADARFSRVKDAVPPQFYTPRPRGDTTFSSLFFYVRSGLDAETLRTVIPRAIASVDPNLAVGNLSTMKNLLNTSLSLDRIVTLLSTTLAALATVLAAVGLYGVLSYNVAQRTRELGLRLALGAQPRALRLMVLKQVGFMALVGGALGLGAAVASGQIARTLLYGLSGYDPKALLAAVAVLAVVILAAAYIPARRASRVAPLEALRYE
ncbi:MAG TPA: ABC transporter permease [Gammaproteobacteria bacterium]|nr:ABC transporter permease [Gammaproteobacteria bacterium]